MLVVDGGLVSIPGLRLTGGGIDTPAGAVYACLAETVLLAMDGHTGHVSIGTPTIEQADHVTALARRHGVWLAPFHSFGRPLAAEPVYPAVDDAVA